MLKVINKENIISEFPNIKLSYENVMHKKVYSNQNNYVSAIPFGKKNFAWFTNYDNKNVCFILELSSKNNFNKIEDIKIYNCCFNYELCSGSIFYGTIFTYEKNNYFTIEDIHYYKSTNVSDLNWLNKLELINNIMTYDIKQVSYNKNFITFGIPLMYNNFEDFYKNMDNIKYKIYCAQFRYYDKSNISYNLLLNNFENYNNYESHSDNIRNDNIRNNYNKIQKISNTNRCDSINIIQSKNKNINVYDNKTKNTNDFTTNFKRENNVNKEIIFQIRPDIQNDIYHLYCIDNADSKLINHDIAFIPDYKTSVMMNKLFRNIKENINLDLLEESDDEEEFENEKEDRFVFLEKKIDMVCGYNYKFKKWYPIRTVTSDKKYTITNKKDLFIYEKNKH